MAIGGNEALVDALSRCFLEHGGTILVNCPVKTIELCDGRATAVVLDDTAVFPGARLEARQAIVSNVGARMTLELVGEQAMAAIDSRLATKMKHWKMDER